MAKSKLKILYGEGDEDILKAQAATLGKAGHTVQQAVGRKAVDEAIRKNSFDLVVLGATLTRNDRHHLPYMIKKVSTETKVLVMHADGSRHPYVDACTDTGSSMESVLNHIEAMNLTGTARTAAPRQQVAKLSVARNQQVVGNQSSSLRGDSLIGPSFFLF